MKYLNIILIALMVTTFYASPSELSSDNGKTDSNVTGHVIDIATGEHIPFVTIQLKGTSIGAVSDITGHFILSNLPAGEQTLIFSMVGYETIEKTIELEQNKTLEVNVALSEISTLMDQVVVTSNKYATKKREASTIVNVISPRLFEQTASNCMADVLDFQPGLRVEQSCSNCGAPQLRINGLDGQYSQILMDNRPVFSSLAAVYGLEQIPAGMVDRVEIVRGGGSAIFGANAIGGVVNIITKEPDRNTLTVQNNTSLIGGNAWDVNANLNASLVSPDSKMGAFLFGVIRSRDAFDSDKDGFSEIPKLASTTIGLRSFFKTSAYSRLILEYHNVRESRRGGDSLDLPPHEANIAESTTHNINTASLRWDGYSSNERHFFSVYSSIQHINRDSYFGTDKDPNAYGKTLDLTAVAGAQYRFHMYNCLFMPADLSAGVEYTHNNLHDRYSGYNREIRQKVDIIGGYLQNEWKNRYVSWLIGLRVEKHNLLKLPVVSPRVNVRYTPIEQIVLRATYSSGYRAPQIYDEDLHVGAVGGTVSMITVNPDLKPEMSHSASLSADWQQRFGDVDLNLTLEGFFTRLNNVFVLEEIGMDDNGILQMFRTNSKGAMVSGLNFEAKLSYKKLLAFQLGYTFQKSRYVEPLKWSNDPDIKPQNRMFRSPDHYAFFMADINPFRRFTVNLSGKLTGPMLVQHFAGFIPEDTEVTTPTFFDMGIKISYDIPLYRLYSLGVNVGMKNIFNAYQRDFDTGINRDASYIYGPSLPRTFYFGVDFKL